MTTENHRPLYLMCIVYSQQNGHHGHAHMVVGFTTTNVISAYHHWSCEFKSRSGAGYSIQHYVIKFISDLRQVCGFLQVLGFHLPIKLTCTKYLKYCWSGVKHHALNPNPVHAYVNLWAPFHIYQWCKYQSILL